MPENSKDPVNFEQAIDRLEKIVNLLDQNDASLEQALDLFQEGVGLIKHCNHLLDSAEKKVKILLDSGMGGGKEEMPAETLFEFGEK